MLKVFTKGPVVEEHTISFKIELSASLLLYACVFLLFYTVYGAVYRRCLGLTAKIPGFKLAALTFCY